MQSLQTIFKNIIKDIMVSENIRILNFIYSIIIYKVGKNEIKHIEKDQKEITP